MTELKPTHYCVVCAARWINWPDGTWSTQSPCGPCCDNVPMDQAPIAKLLPDGSGDREDYDRVRGSWDRKKRAEEVARYGGRTCAICNKPFEAHERDWTCPIRVRPRFKPRAEPASEIPKSDAVTIGTRCKLCGTAAPDKFYTECNRPECPHRPPSASGTSSDDALVENGWERFEHWFFKECNVGTRRHLFAHFGLPVDEISNHGIERIALKHVRRAILPILHRERVASKAKIEACEPTECPLCEGDAKEFTPETGKFCIACGQSGEVWKSTAHVLIRIKPFLDSDRAKIAAAEENQRKLSDEIIPDLNNIARAIEEEGDRTYFGSTNDADELKQIANWLDHNMRLAKWEKANG